MGHKEDTTMILKALAGIVVTDGVLAVVVGDPYMRWLRDHLPYPVPPIETFFLSWPKRLFRAGAALQAVLGVLALWWLASDHAADGVASDQA
jgi:hypothetical protein